MKKLTFIILVTFLLLVSTSAFAVHGIKGLHKIGSRFAIEDTEAPRIVDRTSDVITSTTTISNTTAETTIYTASVAAGDLYAGNLLRLFCSGILSNVIPVDDIELAVFMGDIEIARLDMDMRRVNAATWYIDVMITVRAIGSLGQMAVYGSADIGSVNAETVAGLVSIDTTIVNNLTLRVKWDAAKEGNTISIFQGRLTRKN